MDDLGKGDKETVASKEVDPKAEITSASKICGLKPDTIGVISVVLVTLLWIASSFLTKTILGNFDKPFFLTYLSIVAQQIYYVFLLVPDPLDHHLIKQHLSKASDEESKASATGDGDVDVPRPRPRTPSVAMTQPVYFGEPPEALASKPVTSQEILQLGASLFLFYLAALYLSYLSYQYTAVSSATITGSSNGVFLLLLGVLFRFDRFTSIKVAAILCSILGCLILVLAEWKDSDRTVGNLMGLGSSFFYAFYSILLHKLAKDPFRVSNPILFAVVGSFTMLLAWPMFIILHIEGIETFVLPEDLTSWTSILFNVIFGSLLPNYLWNVAYTLTTPFKCAMGISISIPAVLLLESLSGEIVTLAVYLSGFLLVAGFLAMNSETFIRS